MLVSAWPSGCEICSNTPYHDVQDLYTINYQARCSSLSLLWWRISNQSDIQWILVRCHNSRMWLETTANICCLEKYYVIRNHLRTLRLKWVIRIVFTYTVVQYVQPEMRTYLLSWLQLQYGAVSTVSSTCSSVRIRNARRAEQRLLRNEINITVWNRHLSLHHLSVQFLGPPSMISGSCGKTSRVELSKNISPSDLQKIPILLTTQNSISTEKILFYLWRHLFRPS